MKNEFTFEIETRQIKSVGTQYLLKAKKEECEALAKRFSLVKLNNLSAEIDVKAENKHNFIVEVSFKASIRQICGITLEEFDKELEDDFIELFTTKHIDKDDINVSLEEEVSIEVKEGIIDIGEVVSEHLGLIIPTFPKKEGVYFDFKEENIEKENPFSILKNISK